MPKQFSQKFNKTGKAVEIRKTPLGSPEWLKEMTFKLEKIADIDELIDFVNGLGTEKLGFTITANGVRPNRVIEKREQHVYNTFFAAFERIKKEIKDDEKWVKNDGPKKAKKNGAIEGVLDLKTWDDNMRKLLKKTVPVLINFTIEIGKDDVKIIMKDYNPRVRKAILRKELEKEYAMNAKGRLDGGTEDLNKIFKEWFGKEDMDKVEQDLIDKLEQWKGLPAAGRTQKRRAEIALLLTKIKKSPVSLNDFVIEVTGQGNKKKIEVKL